MPGIELGTAYSGLSTHTHCPQKAPRRLGGVPGGPRAWTGWQELRETFIPAAVSKGTEGSQALLSCLGRQLQDVRGHGM